MVYTATLNDVFVQPSIDEHDHPTENPPRTLSGKIY